MTDNNKNKIYGAIDVNGPVTPITKQPVEQIDAEDWDNLNVSQLWDQRAVLVERMNYVAANCGPHVSVQLQRGIARLDALIESKHKANGEINLI